METPADPGVRRRRLALALWLLQLVFPTAGLVSVRGGLDGRQAPGADSPALLGVVLAWYVGCLLALGVARVRRWVRTHPAQLVTLYASTSLALVGVEAFCRYHVAAVEGDTRALHSRLAYAPDLGWKLVPGQDGVGPHGWRGPPRSRAKPGGCFRIVCAGDSTTHGYSCPWQDAWPHQLEALLNADEGWVAAHGRAEVINLGVPAYGTDQELLALRQDGLSFHPDVVILHLCVNDFADVSFDHDWRMAGGVIRYKPLFALEGGRLVLKRAGAPLPRYPSGRAYDPDEGRSLGWRSALGYEFRRFLKARAAARLRRADGNLWPIHAGCHAEYARARPLLWALVREMAAAARAAGGTFLVTLSPTLLDHPTDDPPWRVWTFLREFHADAAAAGVPGADCLAEYFAEGGNARFRPAREFYHLNREGNALVARHAARWLREHPPAPRRGTRPGVSD
jgi:lysophospholipase L1-like esterase